LENQVGENSNDWKSACIFYVPWYQFVRKHNGLLVLDATGVGDPVYDDLRHMMPRIEPAKLTNMSKAQLIQRLIAAIEQHQVARPAAWSVVTDELKRYEYKLTPNGAITYNAPGGYHDDCVIALALANSGRFEHKWVGQARVFGVRRGEAILRVGRMRLEG
jgi:hypothetical protein